MGIETLRNTPFKIGTIVINGRKDLYKIVSERSGAVGTGQDSKIIKLEPLSNKGEVYEVWNMPPYCGKTWRNEKVSSLDIISLHRTEKLVLKWD